MKTKRKRVKRKARKIPFEKRTKWAPETQDEIPVKKEKSMPKNSLYDGQKINAGEPGEQSPEEHPECPEDCPFCPPSRCYEDCLYTIDCPTTLPECIYNDLGKETAANRKLHAMRDEGELDEFGRRKDEGEL